MNTLFKPPAPVPITDRMTPHQRTAWQMVTSTPGGVYADEIGARVHSHSDDERCNFCGTQGMAICRSKALRGLVIRRKATGKWEPREARYRAQEPSGQTADVDSLFGGA